MASSLSLNHSLQQVVLHQLLAGSAKGQQVDGTAAAPLVPQGHGVLMQQARPGAILAGPTAGAADHLARVAADGATRAAEVQAGVTAAHQRRTLVGEAQRSRRTDGTCSVSLLSTAIVVMCIFMGSAR
jgi:hypothetical protein